MRFFQMWAENKTYQAQHYLNVELLLEKILKELKGGKKNGKLCSK